MIKMQVIGHLGSDCVIRDNGSQRQAINFDIAHTEKYKDAQGVQKERTVWVQCTVWREQGKTGIAQYLKKGTLVFVEGNPSVNAYTGNDGTVKGSLRMNVSELQLLGSSNAGASAAPQSSQSSQSVSGGYSAAPQASEPVDDLPF